MVSTSPAKRFGYVVAAGCNAALLYVAHRLLDWEWPRFLTDDFEQVLPLLTLSLVSSITTNLAFTIHDGPAFKSACNMVNAGLSFAVTLRLLRVFPFDFSSYGSDWSWLIRTVLVVALIGTAIGAVVELVKLLTRGLRAPPVPSRAAGGAQASVPSPDRHV